MASSASGQPEADPADNTDQVRQLIEAGLFRGAYDWWETVGASAVIDMASSLDLVVALAGLIEVLRGGENPEWVVGSCRPEDAVTVTREWLGAGIDAGEVASWLRAGCWDPKAARSMVDVGIRPVRLLDDRGEPTVLVDLGPDDPIPLAQAVADSYLTAQQAVRHLVARASNG